MGVLRYDIGTLRPPVRLPNGMLRVDGTLTRTGVFEYLNPDGSMRREYRPEVEVFKRDSMETFAMVPFTDGHPSELVTASNAKRYAVGSLGEDIRKDGDTLAATIAVFDEQTIGKMERGAHALSCGYEVDLDETPGTAPDGQRYDAVQRNIRGNHVALVSRGRAGDTARVRMDGAIMQPERNPTTMTIEEMKQAMDTALAEAAAQKARADGLEANIVDLTKRADEAEGKLESVSTELTDLQKKRTDEDPEGTKAELNLMSAKLAESEKVRADAEAAFPTRLADAVSARVKLEQAATLILPKERLDDLDDRKIMDMVVAKLHGIAIPSDRSDDYARARFDAAVEGWKAGNTAIDQLRVLAKDDKDGVREDAASAHAAMVKRNQDAWKAAR